ncbi:MAG: hypothetical protein MK116_10350 [Phycisphaerales bacterium]|nr:hypothetical protein [Phycisphaerales bacterium]
MRRFFLIPAAATVLSLAGLAAGQSDDGAPDPDAAHRDMSALETVNNTAGDMLENTNKRIAQMQEFLKEKGELQDYRSSGHGDMNNDGKLDQSDLSWNMSFDQALSMTKQHDAAIATMQEKETPDQRRVDAYRKLVKSTWDDLHQKMAEVHGMSEYLSAKGQFNEYQQWAQQRNADANKELVARRAQQSQDAIALAAERTHTAEDAMKARQEAMKKQHEQFVKNSWQQYKFNQEQYTKRFKYSEKYNHGYWNGYNDNYPDVYGSYGMW